MKTPWLSMTFVTSLYVAISLALSACSNQADPKSFDPTLEPTAADAKPITSFAVSRIELPALAVDSDRLGFDLDSDSRHAVDNKVGQLTAMFKSWLDWDSQAVVDAQMRSGEVSLVGVLHADGVGDQDSVAFDVGGGRLYGNLRGRTFRSTVPGEITISLGFFPGLEKVPFRLVGTRVEATVGADGSLTGRIGGAIPADELRTQILPALYRRIVEFVTAAPHATGATTLLQLLDANKDGAITEQEFLTSNAVASILSPDVDLLDESQLPAVEYGANGVRDGLSVGFGFTATVAQ